MQTLIPIHYTDIKEGIQLEGYAYTLIYSEDGKRKTLTAIHFGGYPEHVKGLSDAICGGGTITAELPEGEITLLSRKKQYDRQQSREGVYSQAILRLRDDAPEIIDKDQPEETQKLEDHPPGSCWLFVPRGDRAELFREIDRRIRVPLIPEFQEYLLSELQKRGILVPQTVFSVDESTEAWELKRGRNDRNIAAVVERGLRKGAIRIPGATPETDAVFRGITGVSSYLKTFGISIAERIQQRYLPLYDPAKEPLSKELLEINAYIQQKAGYSLYEAQLAVAEAAKRRIDSHAPAMIIAECGSGKSKIGAAALIASHMAAGKLKSFNLVLCPSHMTEKWQRELSETIPNAVPGIIRGINSLKDFYREYEKYKDKHFFAVLSKEKARDGYMRRPAVHYNQRLQAYLCPSCMRPVTTDLGTDSSAYQVTASSAFFRKENSRNHKCPECGEPLWAPLMPDTQSEWVKVTDWGFVHRQNALQDIEACRSDKIISRLREINQNPDGAYPTKGACRRCSISGYIAKKMGKNKIDGLIGDELHQFNNDSGQGDAMAELYRASGKFIGMTATLINGYASGIFNLLYRLTPGAMLRDGKKYTDFKDFCDEYGVVETIYETESEYNANRRSMTRKLRDRLLPGVSPLVYSRFLLENAVFLSLSDMGKELPEYEEIPVAVPMREDVEEEYRRLQQTFQKIIRSDRRIAQKVLSAFMGLLTVYPDQPYGHKPIVHPLDSEIVLADPQDLSCPEELQEKDRQVLELVERKVQDGERVLIYTSWVRIDTQEKLLRLLTEKGIPAAVLSARVPPGKREAWVNQQVENGVQVLICNPSVVETGLDLIPFTTLIYYNISYNLFTLRQSSRRSWRINQSAPRIEVYFFYYKNTMQNRAMELMASKLAVASVIEGNMSDEGLAAMSDCKDLTSQLAKELASGIRCEVEDLSEVFGRMAIRHAEEKELKTVKADVPQTQKLTVEKEPFFTEAAEAMEVSAVPEPETVFLFASPKRSRRKAFVPLPDVEEQLSLFGIPA